MRYRTLLIDADDTLLDFKRSEHNAISEVLFELKLTCDDSIIETYSRINDSLWKLLEVGGITKEELKTERFRKLCNHYGFDVSPEMMAGKYVEALSNQSYLLDSAEDVCKSLYDAGVKLYIITNGIKYIQTKRFSATPLAPLFEKVFISEEMGFEKPRVEFFEKACSMIEGFNRESALVVGDSLTSDIKGGIAFGLDTCWFNPKVKTPPEDMNITFEINKLTFCRWSEFNNMKGRSKLWLHRESLARIPCPK